MTLAASPEDFVATSVYRIMQLRGDLDRFIFLLGGGAMLETCGSAGKGCTFPVID